MFIRQDKQMGQACVFKKYTTILKKNVNGNAER